ncbi:hypothetical protein [Coleofasciculus sp. G3-WIS-01]|uniref:hypothetical protein n=1 Tax=Coleofasciculus sp. G3-WIS-01 TaxID=3069528 RepID=UPI004063EA82
MVWASPNHFEDFLVIPFRGFATCLDWLSPTPGSSAAQAVSFPASPVVLINSTPRFLIT